MTVLLVLLGCVAAAEAFMWPSLRRRRRREAEDKIWGDESIAVFRSWQP